MRAPPPSSSAQAGRHSHDAELTARPLSTAVATVYEQAGAVYGGQLEWFRRLEAKAKAARRGMWAQDKGAYISPAAFKASTKVK